MTNILNTDNLGQKITEEQMNDLADEFGIDLPSLRAVIDVESNGKAYYKGSYAPVVLYEGHWFHRLTKGKFDKSNPELSFKKADYKWYKLNQPDRVEAAFKLNEEAALMSASWGCMQVMGFNYAICGYANIFDFVRDMFISEYYQIRASLTFMKSKNILRHMLNNKFSLFAYSYNGANYERNDYHNKLKKAKVKWIEYYKVNPINSINSQETSQIKKTNGTFR
jgi:hypothetical protein